MGAFPELPSLHSHRLNHNSSKLPRNRVNDLYPVGTSGRTPALGPGPVPEQGQPEMLTPQATDYAADEPEAGNNGQKRSESEREHEHGHEHEHEHARNDPSYPLAVASFASSSSSNKPNTDRNSNPSANPSLVANSVPSRFPVDTPSAARLPPRPRIKAVSARRETWNNGPPPAMFNNRSPHFDASEGSSTVDWVANQSLQINTTPTEAIVEPAQQPQQSPKVTPTTPLIPPIRAFKTSRRSSDMNATSPRIPSMDADGQDETLRPVDGFDRTMGQRALNGEQEEQNSDDSDLFLKLAREEAANNLSSRGLIRRSQIDRQSAPPSSSLLQSTISRRPGSDQESTLSRPAEEQGNVGLALAYTRTNRERGAPLDDITRNRYDRSSTSRSGPTTPKSFGTREISPESHASLGGRRPSIPDTTQSARPGYRHSNLSYSTPRTYNSSPLVSRTADPPDAPETPRVDGTESTVSTTAPSTVWDELEDLKSRIHRLELTGKLPATSGAAISRASHERPHTATTTVTTMSSSPKRGRGNSISPTEAPNGAQADSHPLLHSALAKSRTFLSTEIYRALEATASDALHLSGMIGSSGQPVHISSSQSTVGGSSIVSDRQVRRKADSICRSLTELCIALSEAKTGQNQEASSKNTGRPGSRDASSKAELDRTQRPPPVSMDLVRAKSSPRTLSRLEARRSSLLNTSSLPSPKHSASEAGTPTQTSIAGRRTSMLLRNRIEDAEDGDENRFRAPSRANTEIARPRNITREYVPQQQQQQTEGRSPTAQSSLPVRRHYVSTSLTNTGPNPTPPLSGLGSRRYLDRTTPERDIREKDSMISRLADERGQRRLAVGPGFPLSRNSPQSSSIARRIRNPDSPQGPYQ